MHWLNLKTAFFHSREFVSASRKCQGVFMHLMTFCAEQENDGRIVGCASWSRREWAATQVSYAEVKECCGLWTWDGDDLVVKQYPLAHQLRSQALSGGGKNGGSSTSEAKTSAARENGKLGGRPRKTPVAEELETSDEETQKPKPIPSLIEGNGIEKKGTVGSAITAVSGGNNELWATFPQDEYGAQFTAKRAGVAEEFAVEVWKEAMGRNQCDGNGNPIRHWENYLRSAARNHNSSNGRPVDQLKVLEKDLEGVKEELRRIPRPNPLVLPDDHAVSEKLAAPLRKRKKKIEKKIDELNAKIGGFESS